MEEWCSQVLCSLRLSRIKRIARGIHTKLLILLKERADVLGFSTEERSNQLIEELIADMYNCAEECGK